MWNSCIIMDIDGTLANAEHRLHLLPANGGDWESFLAAAPGDSVNEEIRVLNNTMAFITQVVIVTGRSETTRAETVAWLNQHGIEYDHLLMRPEGDRREDTEVKAQALSYIRTFLKLEPMFAVEDRARVAAMWREHGLRCLHVCEGLY